MPPRKRTKTESVAMPSPRRRSGRISSNITQTISYTDLKSDTSDAELPSRKRGRPAQRATKSEQSDDQYENEPTGDAESDDDGDNVGDDDESVPPRVEIIPLEKMRDNGGVAYKDDKLHSNTLWFLRDLKANNRRPWLKAHDGEYRRALKDWHSFVEATTESIAEIDETIPELPVKDVCFRIHRDVRFSKDQTPYKPHFSAAWSRTGRKGPYAVYYIHCEPGASFIGGGLWHPEAQFVRQLRRSIDRRPERWYEQLANPLFLKAFFPELKANAKPKDLIAAFAGKNQSNALKKRPSDYPIDHRDIDLLKLKNYTVGKRIDAEMLCTDDAQVQVKEVIAALHTFVSFLNSIVMPDPGADNSTDESDE